MIAVFYYLSFLLIIFAALAMPSTPIEDTEALLDSTTPSQSFLHIETMIIEKNSSVMGISSTNGDNSVDVGDASEDVSDTSELLGFNLSLFPTSSIFGVNPMFQKLQESLRVIRDQLNTLWSINEDSYSSLDIPDNYVNSTSHSKFVNGTLVTVNETIYKLTSQDGIQSFYHTKAISIYPENDTDSTRHQLHISHENEARIDHSAMRNLGNAAEDVDIEIENSTEVRL